MKLTNEDRERDRSKLGRLFQLSRRFASSDFREPASGREDDLGQWVVDAGDIQAGCHERRRATAHQKEDQQDPETDSNDVFHA